MATLRITGMNWQGPKAIFEQGTSRKERREGRLPGGISVRMQLRRFAQNG
jgi:hypothetical protein